MKASGAQEHMFCSSQFPYKCKGTSGADVRTARARNSKGRLADILDICELIFCKVLIVDIGPILCALSFKKMSTQKFDPEVP